jgi:hypothetical protein
LGDWIIVPSDANPKGETTIKRVDKVGMNGKEEPEKEVIRGIVSRPSNGSSSPFMSYLRSRTTPRCLGRFVREVSSIPASKRRVSIHGQDGKIAEPLITYRKS